MPGYVTSWFRALPIIRLAAVTLFALFLAGIDPVAAGESTPAPTTERITVAAVLCTSDDCFDVGDRLAGFEITAVDIDSEAVLDSCVTVADGAWFSCVLEVPFGSRWTLTFDESQTPAGHAFFGSIIAEADGPYGTITYLPFIPVEQAEPGHLVVQAALCTDASCDEFERLLDGFLISAVDAETGEEYGECMTGNAQQALDHQCVLDFPADAEIELDWYEEQVPDGYAPFGEPIESGEPVVTTLAFVPAEDDAPAPTPTPAPVTALPVTGSGEDAGRWAGPAMLIVAFALMTSAAGAGALQRARR